MKKIVKKTDFTFPEILFGYFLWFTFPGLLALILDGVVLWIVIIGWLISSLTLVTIHERKNSRKIERSLKETMEYNYSLGLQHKEEEILLINKFGKNNIAYTDEGQPYHKN